MGRVLFEQIEDWAGGVVTSIRPDELPPNASPRGWNSELHLAASSEAVVRTRRGLLMTIDEAISGNPEILGLYNFRPRNLTTGTLTNSLLVLTATGRLEHLFGGTWVNKSTSFDSTSPNFPDFETANNLCFIANGTDLYKVNAASGTLTVENDGIDPPSAPTAVATGAGVMTGDYEVALTFYNSVTGHESSRSPATSVTLASEQLRVTIPNATDPQVDYVRIHIRKESLNAFFFRVSSGTGYNSTHGGWADNYGNVDLNLSDDDLNNFIILSPDEDENDRRPAGIRYLAWHQSRMFGSDGKTLYYTKIGKPESWDPEFTEKVNEDDGQLVTGLHSVGGILLIFKSRSIYGLFGDDPNSWYIRLLDADTGCASHRSIVTIEGKTYYWSHRGPMQLSGTEVGIDSTPIGGELISETISTTALELGAFDEVVAAPDSNNERIIFAVASEGSTKNDLLLPWNYRLNRWEASKWDPMDAAALAPVVNSDDIPFAMLGSYQGMVFWVGLEHNDAHPGGTSSGTFVAGATSISSITGTGFWNSGGTLRERKITLLDADGNWVARAVIASNDATTLTLESAVTGLTSGATYTYIIASPDFQWDTAWRDFEAPFLKKRFEYLWVQTVAAAATVYQVDLGFDWNPNYGQSKEISSVGSSTLWDYDLWDHSSYGTAEAKVHRLRVGRTGRIWRVRVRSHLFEKPITLLKVGMRAEQQTSKIG